MEPILHYCPLWLQLEHEQWIWYHSLHLQYWTMSGSVYSQAFTFYSTKYLHTFLWSLTLLVFNTRNISILLLKFMLKFMKSVLPTAWILYDKSDFLGLCQMVRQNGCCGLLWPHFQILTPAGFFACSTVASIGTVAAVETFIAKLFSP